MAVVDPRVTEFQCIMPIGNVPSIMAHGILSYERAAKLAHHSVAMQEIQDKRDQKQVPGGLKLHQYANLYFHARNPMLYKRKDEAADLCVLRVSTAISAVAGVVFADCNASSGYVRFLHPWRHPGDPPAYYRHRSRKCAEVLVPHRVEPARLLGAYVVDQAAAQRLAGVGFALPIEIDPVLFFR